MEQAILQLIESLEQDAWRAAGRLFIAALLTYFAYQTIAQLWYLTQARVFGIPIGTYDNVELRDGNVYSLRRVGIRGAFLEQVGGPKKKRIPLRTWVAMEVTIMSGDAMVERARSSGRRRSS